MSEALTETLFRTLAAALASRADSALTRELAMRAARLEELRLEPGFAQALVDLGKALLSQGLYREACTCYRAIEEGLESAEDFSNLGNAYRAQGEYEEAVACYRQACALKPECAAYAVNLAAGLINLQRNSEAEEWARRAIRLEPDMAEALSNLSVALAGQGRFGEAETFARQALERAPGTASLHQHLGLLLLNQRRFTAAETELRQALALQPDYPQAVNHLAIVLHQQDREEEAAALCGKLVGILPHHAEAWANLGIVRQAQGRNTEAIVCFEEALKRKPEDARSRVCRSLSLLAEGRFAEGFEEYEWRWKMLPRLPRAWSHPAWDGSSLHGRTILLWAEQGLGDTVQFARYASLVAAQGARVIVECQDCLAALVGSIRGISQVVTRSQELPPFDVQAPLLGLPRLFRTSEDSIPQALPYLYADPARVAICRTSLGPPRGLRVGLVWAGSPLHATDRLRSIPLAKLAALREIPDVEWYALQVEDRVRREACGEAGWLRDPLDSPNADCLAAIMNCLDLVISVDTMPAHLAGALGLPVWTLLPHTADWRWRSETERSLWYPGMRLFRQPRPGDWDAVVAKVYDHLREQACKKKLLASFKLYPPEPIRSSESRNERRSRARSGNGTMPTPPNRT